MVKRYKQCEEENVLLSQIQERFMQLINLPVGTVTSTSGRVQSLG